LRLVARRHRRDAAMASKPGMAPISLVFLAMDEEGWGHEKERRG
jgi:hypothetical protein